MIGEGFDAGLRIARLPDSSLIARRLCAMPRFTVATPAYLKRWGRPTHPMHLAEHKCFGYAYLSTPGVRHYTNASGEQASVRPAGQLRLNNGEAVMPALLAGLGIADLPDFIVGDAIASGEVEVILKGWKQPEGAVHLVTPPGGPRPHPVPASILRCEPTLPAGEGEGSATIATTVVSGYAAPNNQNKISGEEPP